MPKRSTQSTSATSSSPSSRGTGTMLRQRASRDRPPRPARPGRPRCRGGRPPARTRRGRRTWPPARRAGSAASVSSTARSAPPAMAAAGASSPLSGPTSTPSPSAISTATARRSVPTPGSTTASTTPARHVLDGPHQGERRRPGRRGADLVGEVDDGDVAGEIADDGLHDADELVGGAEVGEERDGVVRAAHGCTLRRRSATVAGDPSRDANRAGADPPTAPALPAQPGRTGAPPRGGQHGWRPATDRLSDAALGAGAGAVGRTLTSVSGVTVRQHRRP